MPKNEMLGNLIHSKPHTGQFGSPNHSKEMLQAIRDFKADMNGAINTISDDNIRATISGIFGNHIVRLENKIYSLEDEIK